MPVSVNQILANTLGLADPLGRVANDGRVGFNGRVNINGRPIRFAPNFDGVDDFGVLANRAINPDGDIDIEWYQASMPASGTRAIVNQCDSATIASREFNLRWNAGFLEMAIGGGGVINPAASDNVQPAIGRWRVTYSGLLVRVFFNGALVFSRYDRTRGTAREPAAPTRVFSRNNGGSFLEHQQGIIYNIRINGTLWRMADRNQAIQPSTPAGNNMTLVNVTSDRWQEVPQ